MAMYKDVEPLDFIALTDKSDEFCEGVRFILEVLDLLPAANVVEVVRCKDCKYNDNGDCICPDNITHSYDSEWNEYDHYISIYSDHYCGYGERRDA